MKKIFWLIIAAVVMPAMATEDVHKMYGKEPEPKVPAEIAAQYNQQYGQYDVDNVEDITADTANEEIKDVEKIENVKPVENKKEIGQENKFNENYNPKARFPHGLELGIGVSPTSGLNGFIGYNNKNFDSFWAKRFGIRFDFASYSPIKSKLNKKINDEIGKDGLKINENIKLEDFKINAKHFGALVDFYPFGDTWFLGGLRVSGGYFTGKLDLDAGFFGFQKGDKIGFALNDYFYSYPDNKVYGRALASWKYNGPYLGAGFDLGLFWGFKIYMDAGVVFTGNVAKLGLDIPLDGLKNSAGIDITENSDDPVVQQAYQLFLENKEAALADARKEIDDYPYYPLVKLGFMYRF